MEDEISGEGHLDKKVKEDFLKFQVPIIDLDIKQNDPVLKEIFKRLNRTFYALSNIEKQATEYASTDLMLIAKILADQLFLEKDEYGESGERELDPLIPPDIIKKAKEVNTPNFQKLVLETGVFSGHEMARKVHLTFVLNIIATSILGWYNRNVGISRLLDSTDYNFDDFVLLSQEIEKVASYITKLKLKPNSYWLNKANLYTLFVLLYKHRDTFDAHTPTSISKLLKSFESNLPENYDVAAKEGVNNKAERMIRHDLLEAALFPA